MCHRNGEFELTEVQRQPMRIVRVAKYGPGSGDCEMPNTVYAQWGLMYACIPSGGGGQIAFTADGTSEAEFKFSGKSFVAPDLLYSRAANMPDESIKFFERFRPSDRNASEWYREVLNQGVPMHSAFGLAQSIFKHLQKLNVEYDYPILVFATRHMAHAERQDHVFMMRALWIWYTLLRTSVRTSRCQIIIDWLLAGASSIMLDCQVPTVRGLFAGSCACIM